MCPSVQKKSSNAFEAKNPRPKASCPDQRRNPRRVTTTVAQPARHDPALGLKHRKIRSACGKVEALVQWAWIRSKGVFKMLDLPETGLSAIFFQRESTPSPFFINLKIKFVRYEDFCVSDLNIHKSLDRAHKTLLLETICQNCDTFRPANQ